MQINQIPQSKEFVNDALRSIDQRNQELVRDLIEEKKWFEKKLERIIKFSKFRNKIDKIEMAYTLLISKRDLIEVNKIKKETSDKLFSEALKISQGDERKAISLLFDPSLDIEV